MSIVPPLYSVDDHESPVPPENHVTPLPPNPGDK